MLGLTSGEPIAELADKVGTDYFREPTTPWVKTSLIVSVGVKAGIQIRTLPKVSERPIQSSES